MDKLHLSFVLLLCWTKYVNCQNSKQATIEDKQLLTDLFKNYDKELLPMKGRSKIWINLTMGIESIVAVNEKEQNIVTRATFLMNWYDDYLKWDPAAYNDVYYVSLPPDKIWRPDIIVLNVVEDDAYKTNIDESKNRMIVADNGWITWFVRKTLTTSCPINVAKFPYDVQTCPINLASWTYYEDVVDYGTPLISNVYDEPVFVTNNQWDIKSFTGSVKNREGLQTVIFKVQLKRRPKFYKLNLILPCAVLAFLLNLVFLLPADSGERMGMCLTLLLSQVVFMLVVAEMIPKSSFSVPIVGIYFVAIFFQMVVVIIAICCITKCYYRDSFDSPVSECMRSVVLNKLSYLVGVRRKKANAAVSFVASNNELRKEPEKDETAPEEEKSQDPVEQKLDYLLSAVKTLEKSLAEKDEDSVVLEWRIVGETLNRLSFVFFLLVLIIMTIACFAYDYVHD